MNSNWTSLFIRKVGTVGAINIADRLAAVGLGIFLARTLAPEGYGTYAFVMSQVTLVALLAKLGLHELVLRDHAAGVGNGAQHPPSKLLKIAIILSSSVSLLLILVGFTLISTMYAGASRDEMLAGLMMVAPMAFFEIYAAALRGLGYVVTFQIICTLGVTILTLLTSFITFLMSSKFVAIDVIFIRTASFIVLSTVVIFLVNRATRHQGATKANFVATKNLSITSILSTSLSFLIIGLLHLVLVTIDQLMLGYMVGESSVAIFRVAAEGAQLVAFAYAAGNAIMAPEYSKMHSTGDIKFLEFASRRAAAIVLLISAPIFITLFLFSQPLVTFAFGDAYLQSAAPLSILALGHFIALVFGDPLYILNMTGHHKISMRLTISAVIINVALNAVSIPLYGVLGAAAATTVSFLFLRIMAYFYVRAQLNIECSAVSGIYYFRKIGAISG